MQQNNSYMISIKIPFMYNNIPDPNDSYRLWLEEHAGKQGEHWDWQLSRENNNMIDIAFVDKEIAMMFTLVF